MLMPRRRGWSGGKRAVKVAGRGVRSGAKPAGRGERRGVQSGGEQRHSKSGCSAENQGKPKGGHPVGGPVVLLWKARTNGRPNDIRYCRVRDPRALAGSGTRFAFPLKPATGGYVLFTTTI